jgi:hypothetical protein
VTKVLLAKTELLELLARRVQPGRKALKAQLVNPARTASPEHPAPTAFHAFIHGTAQF